MSDLKTHIKKQMYVDVPAQCVKANEPIVRHTFLNYQGIPYQVTHKTWVSTDDIADEFIQMIEKDKK